MIVTNGQHVLELNTTNRTNRTNRTRTEPNSVTIFYLMCFFLISLCIAGHLDAIDRFAVIIMVTSVVYLLLSLL